jgi:parvulin-like peptidyl-prolyl isomerase
MDMPRVVRSACLALLRSPILHVLLSGVVLFIASRWLAESSFTLPSASSAFARPAISIPHSHLIQAQRAFRQARGRGPTAEEEQAIVTALVDQELLFHYALAHGMQEEAVVQRRLARIARCMCANDDGPTNQAALADRALALGLHHRDLGVHRVLSDAARRLIRSAALSSDPEPADILAYYEANLDAWTTPAETRLSHIEFDGSKHGDAAEARAREALARIRAEGLDMDAALALGDAPVVPAVLPFESDQALERRFGRRFEEALRDAPVGKWYGPVPSRHGQHLVYVHAHRPPRVLPFAEVAASVRKRYLRTLADESLSQQLRQLRSAYDIHLPPEKTG